MQSGKVIRRVITVQAVYYLLSGIWPLVDIRSFMMVTGPKTDIWLVKTVGVLVIAAGVALLAGRKNMHKETVVLSLCCCLAFISVEVYYVAAGVIRNVYFADALLHLVFLLLLAAASQRKIFSG